VRRHAAVEAASYFGRRSAASVLKRTSVMSLLAQGLQAISSIRRRSARRLCRHVRV